eukprot:scaffold2910_cov390-Prasinococcus_capsulatus_cf.AAC.39
MEEFRTGAVRCIFCDRDVKQLFRTLADDNSNQNAGGSNTANGGGRGPASALTGRVGHNNRSSGNQGPPQKRARTSATATTTRGRGGAGTRGRSSSRGRGARTATRGSRGRSSASHRGRGRSRGSTSSRGRGGPGNARFHDGNGAAEQRVVCYRCQQEGHFANRCPLAPNVA